MEVEVEVAVLYATPRLGRGKLGLSLIVLACILDLPWIECHRAAMKCLVKHFGLGETTSIGHQKTILVG